MLRAHESIPLYNRSVRSQTTGTDPEITLHAGGTLINATNGTQGTYHSNVTSVMVKRNAGTMRILFDDPQRVAVTDEWRGETYDRDCVSLRGDTRSRNLLIDLLGPQSPATLQTRTIRYRIEVIESVGPGGATGGEVAPAGASDSSRWDGLSWRSKHEPRSAARATLR